MPTIENDPETCETCDATASEMTCDRCGVSARIIDCGCRTQPRPIAADGHHTYCDDCSEEMAEMPRAVAACEGVIDDGTGSIGIIVRQALSDDVHATAEEIAVIVREAQADAALERLPEQIERLRTAAGSAGDLAQVEI